MLLDDAPGDVQAQAHTSEAPIVDVLGPVEAVEDQRLIFQGYADTAILHAQAGLTVNRPHTHHNRTVVRTVLECVLDQVGQDLFEAQRVNSRHDRLWRDNNLEPIRVQDWITAQRDLDQRSQVALLTRTKQSALLEPGNVEQLEHQILESLSLLDEPIEPGDVRGSTPVALGSSTQN